MAEQSIRVPPATERHPTHVRGDAKPKNKHGEEACGVPRPNKKTLERDTSKLQVRTGFGMFRLRPHWGRS